MKLKEWAEKTGVKYLTAYRWFKAGTLPVKAYQTDSGTIIVEEELEAEKQEKKIMSNNAMSVFLKKTVEFSKNDGSIEDFAAWVLANFSLKFNNDSDAPKYSRVMPKSEEVQKHFQQFIKPNGEKPKPAMFVAPPEALEEITDQPLADITSFDTVSVPELTETFGELLMTPVYSSVKIYDNVAEGVVNRSVDSTPQLNYTGSNSLAPSNYFQNSASASTFSSMPAAAGSVINDSYFVGSEDARLGISAVYPGGFKPTQKELDSASKSLEVTERPRRGRKPSKNSRKA